MESGGTGQRGRRRRRRRPRPGAAGGAAGRALRAGRGAEEMADSASSETVNDSLNKEGRAEAPDCADGLASSKFADSEGKFDKRGRRRGRGTPQDISESKAPEKPLNKQQIWNILFQLHNDPDPLASYRFPATLKNDDRRYIHTACQKLHLKSKSRGSGIHRCLTVWKSDKSVDERLTPLEIHEDILTMFRNHSTSSKHSIKNCKEFMMKVAGMQNKQAFPRSSSANRGNSGHDSKKALGLLQRHLVDRKMDDKFAKLLAFRKNLPAFKMKQQILKLVRDSQVCLISGSTGCGKSTQVPQLILEAEVNKYVCAESKRDVQGEKVDSRAPLRIICTQPRRLSAIALCSRVAEEFGGKVGEYIGYQVRLDSKIGPHTAITFCTVGILLRILQSDPNADRFTHIIVDEVHERDRLTDFLLIILKQIMKRNKHLKIIMMSATLNADKFSKYFATESIQCPEIKIPGMSFPVRVHQLEDVLTLTKYRPRPDQLRVKDAHYLKLWTDYYQKRIPMKTIIEIANLDGASVTEELKPDYELIKSLFTSIVKNMECGAILIFLPGWNEIIKTVDTLALSEIVSRNPKKFKILPLHSSVAPHQQKQIFVRPPKGTWKIIVSTNIAETSLTIDDVLYVIDSGLSKQKSFDAHTGMSSLVSNWTSQASARQRQGRAGRVRAGTCFRLYSGARYHNMEPFETPEMLRTPLEEICLQIKLLRLDDNLFANHKGKIFDFLSLAIEPPTSTMVNKAIELLGSIGAMQKEERLTPLGIVLASMPCDPRLSKMLIFAVALKCLGPILTVGACISYRTPFVMALPFERDRARKKKQHFARGCLSDGIAMYSAYTDWIKAEKEGRGFSFCKQNFLSAPSLRMIRSIRGQLFRLLQNARVIPRECTFPEHNQLNRFSKDFNIVRSVIAVGAYPNVAVGVKQKKRKPYDFMTRDNMKNLKIHPSSVNRFTMKNSKAAESKSSVLPFFPYLAFFEVMRSTDVFLHTTSVASPMSLLFLNGNLEKSEKKTTSIVQVDSFLRWSCTEETVQRLMEMRISLDAVIMQTILSTGKKIRKPLSNKEALNILQVFQKVIRAEAVARNPNLNCYESQAVVESKHDEEESENVGGSLEEHYRNVRELQQMVNNASVRSSGKTKESNQKWEDVMAALLSPGSGDAISNDLNAAEVSNEDEDVAMSLGESMSLSQGGFSFEDAVNFKDSSV